MTSYNPHKVFSPRKWKGRVKRRRAPLSLKWSFHWPFKLKWPFSKGLKKLSVWRLKSFIKTLIIIGFFSAIIGGLVFTWLIALYSRDLPDPNRFLERNIPESTKIYDRTGKILLYDIHGEEKRTLVNLENIAPTAKWATIVAEDRNFYNHKGFDLKGILRAVLVDIIKGQKAQGGSTITQQFIKNAVLTREKTIGRKLRELILSYQLEKKFSKDEILKMYFNEIPYGSSIYGIEAASASFFNKSSKDLDITESAILAAIAKAPTYYSPYGQHTDELEGRVRFIIDSLVKEGYVSPEEGDKAKKEDVLKKIQAKTNNISAPHFVLYIKDLLMEKYGEQIIESGGLKVITTLDWNLQQIAEEEVSKGAETNEKKYNGGNAALVSLDPKTGEVLVMVGSRDYFDKEHDGAVNVAMRPRQPGSSFKPIVYATAFAKGYTPETLLYDVETTFKNYPKDYTPHNYDGKEHGPVTMRQALAGSLNIPAVKTLYLTGVERVLNQAEEMGYTTLGDRSRFGLSVVLGGAEVKLLDHAAAFGVFANEGNYVAPTFILRVEDSSGRVLEQAPQPKPKQVLDRQAALKVVDILSDNNARAYVFGAQSALVLPDRPVAAKTGTTNDWHDGWTMGFTPSLVTGVWVGNNNNKEMKKNADGVLTAGPIWNAFMRRALKGKPVENFNKPDFDTVDKPVLKGEGAGEIKVVIDKISGKLATDWTPMPLREEKIYKYPHCILHFVNKDDPRGPAPANPGDDPQFANWESAVQTWAQKQNYVLENPPSEFDNIHTAENKPSVVVKSPFDRQIVSQDFSVEIFATSPRGIKNIQLFIDDILVGEMQEQPFLTTARLPADLRAGLHTLTAKAFDDVLNEGNTSVAINYAP